MNQLIVKLNKNNFINVKNWIKSNNQGKMNQLIMKNMFKFDLINSHVNLIFKNTSIDANGVQIVKLN